MGGSAIVCDAEGEEMIEEVCFAGARGERG